MNAWVRSLTTVPPESVADVAPPHSVLLLCQRPGCVQCSSFESYGRAALEAEMGGRGVRVVDWDCSDARRRALALDAGVTAVPAYVLLTPTGERTVVSLSS